MTSYLGLVAAFIGAFFLTAQANAENTTKIVTINGNFSLKYGAAYYALPDENFQLGAQDFDIDQFDDLSDEEAIIAKSKARDVSDYQWSSNYSASDSCDLSMPSTCVGTNFEPTPYGVNFTVPANIKKYIKITVRNRQTGTYAELKLVNKNYKKAEDANQSYTPPQTAYTDESEYNESEYDYNSALTGHGQWRYITSSNERVWVPTGYLAVGDWSTWNPYVHGRWVWTVYGWTWHSYDPFGYVTSHYGVWRYNIAFGWVWVPFPTGYCVYRPFVGSFFYTSTGIGWSPFWGGYWWGYTGTWNPYGYGYNHGYRDGYWDGYWAGRNSGHRYGWTYVSNGGFTSVNIYTSTYRETNYTTIVNNYTTVYDKGHFGANIGDVTRVPAQPTLANGSHSMNDYQFSSIDKKVSRELMEKRVGSPIAEEAVSVRKVGVRGEAGKTVEMVGLKNAAQKPEIYRKAGERAKERVRSGTTVPIGSVVDADNGQVLGSASDVDKDRTGVEAPTSSKGRKVAPSQTFQKPSYNGAGSRVGNGSSSSNSNGSGTRNNGGSIDRDGDGAKERVKTPSNDDRNDNRDRGSDNNTKPSRNNDGGTFKEPLKKTPSNNSGSRNDSDKRNDSRREEPKKTTPSKSSGSSSNNSGNRDNGGGRKGSKETPPSSPKPRENGNRTGSKGNNSAPAPSKPRENSNRTGNKSNPPPATSKPRGSSGGSSSSSSRGSGSSGSRSSGGSSGGSTYKPSAKPPVKSAPRSSGGGARRGGGRR